MLTGQGHVVRGKRRAGADKSGACHWVKCQTRSGLRPSLRLLLRRSLFLHRGATRCSARLDRSGVATRLNDERPPFEGPSRTESHCRWRSTPSPCSRLLSHDLTRVRPPLRLSFTLISNAMRYTGASRHTHNRGASTTSVLTGQGHGVRQKREAGADKFGTRHRVRCQTRSGLRPSLRSLLRRSLFLHRGSVLAWQWG